MQREIIINWQEYDRLKKEEKLTDNKIAKILGIALTTLKEKKKEKGITVSAKAINWDRYRELRKKGYSQNRIAEIFGIAKSTLSARRKKEGIEI